MTNSFWAGGPIAYATGLKEHYEARLRELRARLDQCDSPSVSDAIEAEINEVRDELIKKLQEIDRLIF